MYDEEADKLHDPLSQMIVAANLYLKMPATTYDGRRFIVIFEPQLSPHTVNARIYGTDYIVVVSPVNGQIRMNDVRHTYLHYIIDPLLFALIQRHYRSRTADSEGNTRRASRVPGPPLRYGSAHDRMPDQGH